MYDVVKFIMKKSHLKSKIKNPWTENNGGFICISEARSNNNFSELLRLCKINVSDVNFKETMRFKQVFPILLAFLAVLAEAFASIKTRYYKIRNKSSDIIYYKTYQVKTRPKYENRHPFQI